jgi:hypothetical protein
MAEIAFKTGLMQWPFSVPNFHVRLKNAGSVALGNMVVDAG